LFLILFLVWCQIFFDKENFVCSDVVVPLILI